MAAKLQLYRAVLSFRSTSAPNACLSSVAAWHQLLDAFECGNHNGSSVNGQKDSPGHHAGTYAHQEQQFIPATQEQQSTSRVFGWHTSVLPHRITQLARVHAAQPTDCNSFAWLAPEESLHQLYYVSLAANALQELQDMSSGRLCEYSPFPPNQGEASTRSPGEDGSSSSSSSSSTAATNRPGQAAGSSSSAATPADSLAAALTALANSSRSRQLTPSAILKQLDRYIVGQAAAKRAVAVALRNRWRRQQLPAHIAEEITPKNILMVGPTGCGKTEIARRLAKLVEAPFVKVEATKFTELGFVGRDVDEIVKDLMEAAISSTRTRLAQQLREAAAGVVEDILITALCGPTTKAETYNTFRDLYRVGALDESIVEIDLDTLGDVGGPSGGPGSAAALGSLGPPGPAGGSPFGALASMLEQVSRRAHGLDGGSRGRGRGKTKMMISEARKLLLDAEVERFLSSARVVEEALRAAQEDGIVFIDEIDKIVDTSKGAGGATSSNVSSEGVQRDLLPILEGSVVATKYGNVSTEHVLFIASGAFHSAQPGDMLAELQGRLPVKVELARLTADDFYRILTEPQHNMLQQQQVLLATEGVDLHFSDGAVRAIARAAEEANKLLDNIGARRLHTVLERVLADISFEAPEKVAAARQTHSSSSASLGSKGSINSGSSSSGSENAAESAIHSIQQQSGIVSSGRSRCPAGSSKANSSSGSDDFLVHFEVTEDMVEACMEPMLKHVDMSKYML